MTGHAETRPETAVAVLPRRERYRVLETIGQGVERGGAQGARPRARRGDRAQGARPRGRPRRARGRPAQARDPPRPARPPPERRPPLRPRGVGRPAMHLDGVHRRARRSTDGSSAGPIPWPEAMSILLTLALALESAHGLGRGPPRSQAGEHPPRPPDAPVHPRLRHRPRAGRGRDRRAQRRLGDARDTWRPSAGAACPACPPPTSTASASSASRCSPGGRLSAATPCAPS